MGSRNLVTLLSALSVFVHRCQCYGPLSQNAVTPSPLPSDSSELTFYSSSPDYGLVGDVSSSSEATPASRAYWWQNVKSPFVDESSCAGGQCESSAVLHVPSDSHNKLSSNNDLTAAIFQTNPFLNDFLNEKKLTSFSTPRPEFSSTFQPTSYVKPEVVQITSNSISSSPAASPFTGIVNSTPYPGCAAALKCVPDDYCSVEGYISDVPVALTKDLILLRVPLSECQDLSTGLVGKCCRDPNYTDPWPSDLPHEHHHEHEYHENNAISTEIGLQGYPYKSSSVYSTPATPVFFSTEPSSTENVIPISAYKPSTEAPKPIGDYGAGESNAISPYPVDTIPSYGQPPKPAFPSKPPQQPTYVSAQPTSPSKPFYSTQSSFLTQSFYPFQTSHPTQPTYTSLSTYPTLHTFASKPPYRPSYPVQPAYPPQSYPSQPQYVSQSGYPTPTRPSNIPTKPVYSPQGPVYTYYPTVITQQTYPSQHPGYPYPGSRPPTGYPGPGSQQPGYPNGPAQFPPRPPPQQQYPSSTLSPQQPAYPIRPQQPQQPYPSPPPQQTGYPSSTYPPQAGYPSGPQSPQQPYPSPPPQQYPSSTLPPQQQGYPNVPQQPYPSPPPQQQYPSSTLPPQQQGYPSVPQQPQQPYPSPPPQQQYPSSTPPPQQGYPSVSQNPQQPYPSPSPPPQQPYPSPPPQQSGYPSGSQQPQQPYPSPSQPPQQQYPSPTSPPQQSGYPSGSHQPQQPYPSPSQPPQQQPVYPSGPQYPQQPYPSPSPSPQQPGYPGPQQPGYPNGPQQPGYPNVPQQPGYPNSPQQPGYPNGPQQPGYPNGPQQPGYPNGPQQPQQPYPSPPQQQPGYPIRPQQPQQHYPSHQQSGYYVIVSETSYPYSLPQLADNSIASNKPNGYPQVTPTEEGIPNSQQSDISTGVAVTPITIPKEYSATCGVKSNDGTAFGEAPWHAIVYSSKNKDLICAGVIVSENAVLTAAHCLDHSEADSTEVKIGPNGKVFKVAAIARHEKYEQFSYNRDLALVILREPIQFDKYVEKICLPTSFGQKESLDRECYVSTMTKEFRPETLKTIPVQVFPYKDCEAKLKSTYLGKYFVLNDSFSCVSTPADDELCTVKTGSPIACNKGDGTYELFGIKSWDLGCQEYKKSAIFSNFDIFWVQNMLSTPVTTLIANEQSYLRAKFKGESLAGINTKEKPGFGQGYGK